jgi:hypothetical protein
MTLRATLGRPAETELMSAMRAAAIARDYASIAVRQSPRREKRDTFLARPQRNL